MKIKSILDLSRSVAGGCFIFCTTTQRVLLNKRSHLVSDSGTWALFGGMIDPDDESIESGVCREVYEESKLVIYKKRLRLIYIDSNDRVNYYTYFYETEKEMDDIELDWESEDYGWFSLDELPSPLHPRFKEMFNSVTLPLKLSVDL